MTFTLYGSIPSPYVRRIRLYLEGIEHEFKTLNIYDDLERQAFAKLTPIRKLPILQAGETVLFDSHSIAEYLREYKGEPRIQPCPTQSDPRHRCRHRLTDCTLSQPALRSPRRRRSTLF